MAQWHRAVEATLASGAGAALGHALEPEQQQLQVAQVLESYMMSRLHMTVYPWLQHAHRHDDARLTELLHAMRFHTQDDLGIKPAYHCPLDDAVAEVRKIAAATTPLDGTAAASWERDDDSRRLSTSQRLKSPREDLTKTLRVP